MQQVNSTYTLLPPGVENGNDLIRKTLGEVYKELVNAVDRVPQEKTKERKYATILSASERSRLLVDKLITVLKWSKNVDVIDRCGSLVIYDNDNLNTMTNVAMTLNAAVFRLQACLQPIYPIKSALSVLNDGEYPFIPLVCDSKAPFLSRLTKKDGNDLITRILRTRILTEDVPSCCHSITVRDCAIVCEEKGLFSVSFTSIVPSCVPVYE